jgi:hypothetical protein
MVSVTNHTCFINNLQITMPKSPIPEHHPDTKGDYPGSDNVYYVLPPNGKAFINGKSPTTAQDIGGLSRLWN